MRPVLLAFALVACSSSTHPPPDAPKPDPIPPQPPVALDVPDPVQPPAPASTAEIAFVPVAQPFAARDAAPYTCERDTDCVVSMATGTCGPCGGCPAVMSAAEAARRDRAQRQCPARRIDEPVQCGPCPRGPVASVCVDRRCAPIYEPPVRDDLACSVDTDCVWFAFTHCCACPSQWDLASRRHPEAIATACADQPCSDQGNCPAPTRPAGTPRCFAGRCILAPS